MEIRLNENKVYQWKVEKIAVIGPGIVGMPMAALLANARIKIGASTPAKVIVVQRNSVNSGWKVDSINAGKSVIGGIEPGLQRVVEQTVEVGQLSATHDYRELADADVILVCIQTDKKENSYEPDYGPMMGGLESLARALQNKPAHKIPLIIFESTLAPSTMTTIMRTHFESFGLVEGKDILLGNSPNRVMPGRLVDRVTQSDKLVAGLHPETPRMITEIYSHIVMDGNLYATNSLTAEVVKTLENAYRDVRIAYSTEVVRYCDQQDINFYSLRDKVNQKLSQTDTASNNPNAVPSGGILIPMLGVGGHCLPKDGILLWWRKAEKGLDTSHSLILESRKINNESPKETIRLAERKFGSLKGKAATVMGVAYRFNSEDTRNSPSIALALELEKKGCKVCLHDPFVKPDDQNLLKFNVANSFTNNLEEALSNSEFLFFGTAHKAYLDALQDIFNQADQCKGIIDACNLFNRTELELLGWAYTGIGRGRQEPSEALVNYVYKGFRAMERGVANEVKALTEFLNDNYVNEAFNRVDFQEVRRLAASCSTGCLIPDAGLVEVLTDFQGFSSRLVGFASQPYSLA